MKNVTRTLLVELEMKVLRTKMDEAWEEQDRGLYEALKDNVARLGDFGDLEYWEYVYDQHITNLDINEEQFINQTL